MRRREPCCCGDCPRCTFGDSVDPSDFERGEDEEWTEKEEEEEGDDDGTE